jgi:hypothetical protein
MEYVKQSKPGSKGQRSHVFFHLWRLDLKINDLIYIEREKKERRQGENMIVFSGSV